MSLVTLHSEPTSGFYRTSHVQSSFQLARGIVLNHDKVACRFMTRKLRSGGLHITPCIIAFNVFMFLHELYFAFPKKFRKLGVGNAITINKASVPCESWVCKNASGTPFSKGNAWIPAAQDWKTRRFVGGTRLLQPQCR